MKELPIYSILMSVYPKENPEWLKQSIESMLNQTVKTDNFVLVKDGKLVPELDNVISYYKEQYPDIFTIVEKEKNSGLGESLKIGLTYCKNALVARMDSDDVSVQTRIEKQLTKLVEHPEIDLIGSNIGEFEENIQSCKTYRVLPETNEEIKAFSRRRNPFGHSSIIFKKEKVLEVGNYHASVCEDYDLWIRMIENGAKCYNIQEVLVYMRVNDVFYQRRGGIKYLKEMLKFKKEQYKKGFYTKKDYLISSFATLIVCLLPNKLRKMFYRNLLRKKEKID